MRGIRVSSRIGVILVTGIVVVALSARAIGAPLYRWGHEWRWE